MNKLKLTIQNGHRNATNGQTGTSGIVNGVKVYEVDWIDKVYYAIKTIIDSTYSNSIELSYDDATIKNGITADLFIAIHFDGSTDPNYNGGFVDDSPTDQVAIESWKFAQMVADAYFLPIGIRFVPEHRTVNSTNYYAFNDTGSNTKQFIIECGAMTNISDMSKMADYNKIGKFIMNGIVNYTGIKPNTLPTPSIDPCLAVKTQLATANSQIIILTTQVASLQVQVTSLNNKLTQIKSLATV